MTLTTSPNPLLGKEGACAALTLNGIAFGFPTRPDFLGPVDVTIRTGECWAIVGPNGAGKSTLLRLMAGLLTPDSGSIDVAGDDLSRLPARLRAKRIAFVPQNPPTDFDLCVREIVVMGRFPHRSMGLFESADDYAIAQRMMEVTQTCEFADRPLCTLSGGEAQRVHVASSLTQEPQFLLLDEPTASLDLQHQLAIFSILRDRALHEGLAVVVVTHDVNLAARFCSNVLLLDDGQCVAQGSPEEVLTADILGGVYGVSLETLVSSSGSGGRWVVPVGVSTEVGQ